MHRIVVSAPGKVILFGEQVVVLGRVAIATALDLRTTVTLVVPPGHSTVDITLPDLEDSATRSFPLSALKYSGSLPTAETDAATDAGLVTFLEGLVPSAVANPADRGLIALLFLVISISGNQYDPDPQFAKPAPLTFALVPSSLPNGLQITVRSEFQPGVGLGSSAAYNVALAAALLQAFGKVSEADLEVASCRGGHQRRPSGDKAKLINIWAFKAEKIMHGTPSGIDNSICTFGGAVSIKQGKIESIPKIPQVKLIVTNTKVPRSTKQLVANVVAKHKRWPAMINPLLDCVEAIGQSVLKSFSDLQNETDEAKLVAFESDLTDHIDTNQGVLVALGVGHPALDRVVAISRQNGGFHSKLTGAGGGGCAFTLINRGSTSEQVNTLKAALTGAGFDCFEAATGAPGVIYHNSDLPYSPL